MYEVVSMYLSNCMYLYEVCLKFVREGERDVVLESVFITSPSIQCLKLFDSLVPIIRYIFQYLFSPEINFCMKKIKNLSHILKMSFIEVSAENHFPIQNLPYGVFSTKSNVSSLYLNQTFQI